MCMII